MSDFKVGDRVKRVGDSNVEVVQGFIYTIRGVDRNGDLELEGLEDFGYNVESFELVNGCSLPTYMPSELSEINELRDRVDYLEDLCGDYAKIIKEKNDRISSMQEVIYELSSMGCSNG